MNKRIKLKLKHSSKVLHVTTSLNFGGVESHFRIIALNENDSRYEHHFCAISKGGSVSQELTSKGIPVEILNLPPSIPSFSAILGLMRHIRHNRPIILHCRGAEANFHGLIAGFLCRVPILLAEEIGLPNHSLKARFVFRQIYKLASRVVAISEAVKQKLVELGEINPERCKVILNPTQMHKERNRPMQSDRFEIGFAGRLEEVKNPLGLVRAVALLRTQGMAIGLTIVGDGSQRKALEKEVQKLDISEVVVLTGFQAGPFEELKEVNLYVQPSISEGFGIALVEAMSIGIPTLATAVGGAREIINDNENGWLLSGTSPQEIAHGIARVAALSPSQLEAIGIRGRESVLERFSPQAYFAKCDAFYDCLLKQKEG